jgi:hypothetical protein
MAIPRQTAAHGVELRRKGLRAGAITGGGAILAVLVIPELAAWMQASGDLRRGG